MVVMACRLPQDDPYGLCCKKNRDAKDSTTTFKGSSSGFGLLGGKSENGDDGNPANGKPEKPNWLSEESKPTIDEENEIIQKIQWDNISVAGRAHFPETFCQVDMEGEC